MNSEPVGRAKLCVTIDSMHDIKYSNEGNISGKCIQAALYFSQLLRNDTLAFANAVDNNIEVGWIDENTEYKVRINKDGYIEETVKNLDKREI